VDATGFPDLPKDGADDETFLTLIVAGHRGLLEIYDRLLQVLTGDARTVIWLLRLDWKRLVEPLDAALLDLLKQAEAGEAAALIPAPERAADIAKRLENSRLPELLNAVDFMAALCAVSTRVVPWSSEMAAVDALFRRSVEVEDQHLAQVSWLRELLGSSES
jgi:hypothetical protein